ncbi:MAG: hypothetical protein AB1486_04185 [Planctomycetota bacterium]
MSLKNRHLLAAIAVLALASAFVSLFLLITESHNAENIAALTASVRRLESERVAACETAVRQLAAELGRIKARDQSLVGDVARIDSLMGRLSASLDALAAESASGTTVERLREELQLLASTFEAFARETVNRGLQLIAVQKRLEILESRLHP